MNVLKDFLFCKNHFQRKANILILPSFVGVLMFYIIPYIRMLYYSFIESQFDSSFVGGKHYIAMLKNPYFQLAIKNTILFMVILVTLVVLLAIIISISLSFFSKNRRVTSLGYILPMLLPTTSIVIVWRLLFGKMDTVMPIYTLFVWKNIGFGIILFMASFTNISKEFYEAAALDGAGFMTLHKKITIPMIAPAIVFVTLLEIVNSFKIFKESYLYYGTNYPPDNSYTLQFYMNNHFLKLNYQNLAACAVFTSIFVIIIITVMMKLQKRVEF